MRVDLLIHSADEVVCLTEAPQRGKALGTLNVVTRGALAVRSGNIVDVGPSTALRRRHRAERQIDATGCVLLPGFVDPHTHAMWIGDRATEFEQRIAGRTYSEILAAGGGILSTVDQTRAASVIDLVEATRLRLRRMLAHGTTACEIKTGYGLDIELGAAHARGHRTLAAQHADDHPGYLSAGPCGPPRACGPARWIRR